MSNGQMVMPQSLARLVKARARMTILIAVVILFLLTINMLLMSTWTELGSKPLFENSPITIVLAYSIFVVLSGALISAFYIWWANNVLDKLVQSARDEITAGEAA